MKRLNEIFANPLTSGIMNAISNLPLIPWASKVDINKLDLQYHGNLSGDKYISPLLTKILGSAEQLTSLQITEIANLINGLNNYRWRQLWNTYEISYKPLNNYEMTETSSDLGADMGTVTTTANATTEQTNKTAPYDSTTLKINSSGNGISSGTDTRTDNLSHTNQHTLTRSGNIGVTTSQQMLESERNVRMWNFFNSVLFKDVDDILTINIY